MTTCSDKTSSSTIVALRVRESTILRPRNDVQDDDDGGDDDGDDDVDDHSEDDDDDDDDDSLRLLQFLLFAGSVFPHAANCFATLVFMPNGLMGAFSSVLFPARPTA